LVPGTFGVVESSPESSIDESSPGAVSPGPVESVSMVPSSPLSEFCAEVFVEPSEPLHATEPTRDAISAKVDRLRYAVREK
jgi:hypothetical protein